MALSTSKKMGLVMAALLVILRATVTAQPGCTSVLISLAPYLNYVTGSSSTPSASCCSQLATVVQSQPQCLCMILNGGGSSLGVTINQTLALALPGACSVQTPPVSQCNADAGAGAGTGTGAGEPAMAPAASPRAISGESPNGSLSTSGGSKVVPSIDTGSSTMKVYLRITAFSLFVILCSSAYQALAL